MPEIEITKEEYESLKQQELKENNLDVYEYVDIQDDVDDIAYAMEYEYIDEDLVIDLETDNIAYDYDPNANYIYTAPDDSRYVDRTAPVANTTGTAYVGSGVSVDCNDIINNFNKNLKISKYFTLGDVAVYFDRLKDKTITVKDGTVKTFTKYQLACNLKALAINILDPIKEKFPDLVINSTIRNWNGKSEHETAQAADIKFPKHKKKDYHSIVQWIYQNLPYNQLFLEYRPKENSRGGWIHVSYAAKGNQIYGASKYWGSIYNDSFNAPGSKQSFANMMSNCDWYG